MRTDTAKALGHACYLPLASLAGEHNLIALDIGAHRQMRELTVFRVRLAQ